MDAILVIDGYNRLLCIDVHLGDPSVGFDTDLDDAPSLPHLLECFPKM
jgi:hypothetical protein